VTGCNAGNGRTSSSDPLVPAGAARGAPAAGPQPARWPRSPTRTRRTAAPPGSSSTLPGRPQERLGQVFTRELSRVAVTTPSLGDPVGGSAASLVDRHPLSMRRWPDKQAATSPHCQQTPSSRGEAGPNLPRAIQRRALQSASTGRLRKLCRSARVSGREIGAAPRAQSREPRPARRPAGPGSARSSTPAHSPTAAARSGPYRKRPTRPGRETWVPDASCATRAVTATCLETRRSRLRSGLLVAPAQRRDSGTVRLGGQSRLQGGPCRRLDSAPGPVQCARRRLARSAAGGSCPDLGLVGTPFDRDSPCATAAEEAAPCRDTSRNVVQRQTAAYGAEPNTYPEGSR